MVCCFFFFSSRRRHTRLQGDWSSDVCSSDLCMPAEPSTAPTTLTSRLHITRCSTEEGERICCTRCGRRRIITDRKSTRLNSSHLVISYAVFCLKKKKIT